VIPLRDTVPSRRFPLFTVVLIIANGVVFYHELTLRGPEVLRFFHDYGVVPACLTGAGPARRTGSPCPLYTLFTSMFIHGGWLHIIGNMWYLWLFGDNVEDRLGRIRFLIFYVLCGFVAGLAHVAMSPSSTAPTVGASGAVAGVMGAYLLLYPRAGIVTLVPIFFFFPVIVVPAYFFLVLWFLLQFYSGAGAVAGQSQVAFWAHVGGFVAGIVLMPILLPRRKRRIVAWQERA